MVSHTLRIPLTAVFIFICTHYCFPQEPIDRVSLVGRHNVILTEADTLGSLSVGNGEFAFTVDVTGLQTFYQEYENGIPLGTQSQWAWHSLPSKQNFTLADVNVKYPSCDSTMAPYPVQHKTGRAGEATNALRANPHRLHLGRVGFKLLTENGERVLLSDIKKIEQKLDLWTGQIKSKYEIEGVPVVVVLYAHQTKDQIAVSVESDLIKTNRLSIEFIFPYGKDCHVCPGYDFDSPDKHSSILIGKKNSAVVKRQVDSTYYQVNIGWSEGSFKKVKDHQFELSPTGNKIEFSVLFQKAQRFKPDTFAQVQKNSIDMWKQFWTSGGAVDLSACIDPRAKELERRIILSQYLTRIQCAGSLPPQETGLTMNSWFGKFHMEMYWWHGAHFPLWGRKEFLQRSMGWYANVMTKAKSTAKNQGYAGARWQKMTDPYGNESPSDIGAFIIWQQPHPIYLAELLYRADPGHRVINKYKDVIQNSAEFMASFLKERNGQYHLCHPLIPAQEIFKARETDDPAFELQYWHYGLAVAQKWRERSGLRTNSTWDQAMNNLSPLSISDNVYLPNATTQNAYRDDQYRKDHPSVLGAFGFVPYNVRMDTTIMLNTLNEIMGQWNWESTWGWDFPMIAMTATRLHKPELAIDALMMEAQKNTYLVNGHNYQDTRLRLYLPGNGGLLAAIALMTAGWDGNTSRNPGFPKNGKWDIRWEGLQPMP